MMDSWTGGWRQIEDADGFSNNAKGYLCYRGYGVWIENVGFARDTRPDLEAEVRKKENGKYAEIIKYLDTLPRRELYDEQTTTRKEE